MLSTTHASLEFASPANRATDISPDPDTDDPMPENFLRLLGGTSRQDTIVADVWRMRAEAFALAEAGQVPTYDVATGEMRALPRGPLFGFVSVLLEWATEAFHHGEGAVLLVLVMDPLDTSDEPMILDLSLDEHRPAALA